MMPARPRPESPGGGRYPADSGAPLRYYLKIAASERAVERKRHGLDDTDPCRNLHRTRDQRLSAGRVL